MKIIEDESKVIAICKRDKWTDNYGEHISDDVLVYIWINPKTDKAYHIEIPGMMLFEDEMEIDDMILALTKAKKYFK